MVTPADLLVAQKIGIGDPNKENSLTRVLQRLLLETGGGGVTSSENMLEKLKAYRQGKGDQGASLAGSKPEQDFDRIISFYSTAGNIEAAEYPYMYVGKNGKDVEKNITVAKICALDEEKFINRQMTIILVNSPYVNPKVRDAQKVELFLNFLPTIVISRCVPYLELEFVFDRGFDKDAKTGRELASAGMLKFLLGADKVTDGTPDAAMFDARSWTNGQSSKTSAGMELFTAPQTLVNMNPIKPGSRYVDVLDPTRPFASLESVTINVTPTKGIMSYKKATAVIKLHDRSRLAELADLIQPTTYTRSTIWLTYGWRHPYEPNGDTATATYADFINNNMLVKEAYGIANSGFSFDAVGQVTITLELFTKSISELRDIKTNIGDDQFATVQRKIDEIAHKVGLIVRGLHLEPPSGLNKEVRGFMLLDAAQSGQFPDGWSVKDTQEAITKIEKALNDKGTVSPETIGLLKSQLKELYAGDIKKNRFNFKERSKGVATALTRTKLKELSRGFDPFLTFKEKNESMKEKTGATGDHPLLSQIEFYNTKDKLSVELTKEKDPSGGKIDWKKTVVSFGKLFSVFMTPALLTINTIDEYQVIFYMLNDLCGPASCTNIAEFPIDLPVFLRQYKEVVEQKGTNLMTVEEFVKLAVDAQINDVRAIPYGFRSAGIFKPWSPTNRDPNFIDKKGAKKGDSPADNYESKTSQVNGKRGAFVMPQIEVHIETTHAKATDSEVVDALRYYERPGSSVGSASPTAADQQKSGHDQLKKIVRIHIYDKTSTPYKQASRILKSDNPGGGTNIIEVEPEPWVKDRSEDEDTVAKSIYADVWQSVSSDGSIKTHVKNGNLTADINNQKIKHLVSKTLPSIIYGMNASAVLEAHLSTKQDAQLTAAQLLGLNAGKKVAATPAGGGQGGLPLKVIPAALTLRTIGCPLLNYSQQFFIDFNTGTTLDNIYGITGLTHTLTPGKFESSLTMGFYDAYGKYESAPDAFTRVEDVIKKLKPK